MIKLRTTISSDGRYIDECNDSNLEHDVFVAHALIQAIGKFSDDAPELAAEINHTATIIMRDDFGITEDADNG